MLSPVERLSSPTTLPWIGVADGAPYFVEGNGRPWTPVGQNDAITWPEFAGLLAGSNPAAIERHLESTKHSGVTVLRFMLEYCEHGSAFLEFLSSRNIQRAAGTGLGRARCPVPQGRPALLYTF